MQQLRANDEARLDNGAARNRHAEVVKVNLRQQHCQAADWFQKCHSICKGLRPETERSREVLHATGHIKAKNLAQCLRVLLMTHSHSMVTRTVDKEHDF